MKNDKNRTRRIQAFKDLPLDLVDLPNDTKHLGKIRGGAKPKGTFACGLCKTGATIVDCP